MLRKVVYRLIKVLEDQLGVSMAYLRHLLDTSWLAFFKFALFMPMAAHRKVVDPAAYHLVRIISTRAEDCSPCVQLVVNQALKEEVPAEYLRAGLTDKPEELPVFLQDVYHYATAVATQRKITPERRERLVRHLGEKGMVELSLGMASAQVFPLVKRGMGYAKSCRLIDVELEGSRPAVPTQPLEARSNRFTAEKKR